MADDEVLTEQIRQLTLTDRYKATDESPDGQTPDNSIELDQEPIMATAEFEALVGLDAELVGDDESPETAEAPAENDDLFSITDKLKKLRAIEDEEDFGLNPYDNGEQK